MKKTFYIARNNYERSYTEIFADKPIINSHGQWCGGDYAYDWEFEWPKLRPGQMCRVEMRIVK